MRSRHYTVLSASAERGGLSQRELGEVLGVDPSAVVALVDDLERSGLVRRDPHPDDRRTRLVVVTDRGTSTLAEVGELARRAEDELLGALSRAERRTLAELLQRVGL
ncbi:MarR family transcriptional regulator [Saccharomonospora sp. NPDC046836]|uniref:MarR family winged helix-turn-helix transcriptional regulator n=1 Tax=Saccharomonospora sp. NPDC046836 TaxID=3156921 RepID=UPI0033F93D27